MTDSKATERQRRYRVREQARARAVFAGATEIEIAWFGVNAEGQHVAIGYDGNAIPLNVIHRHPSPSHPVETQLDPTEKPKAKIYAPKSWDPARWNGVVSRLAEQSYDRSDALEEISKSTTLDEKQQRQATAVIEAMPDVPDWYAHLPLAD